MEVFSGYGETQANQLEVATGSMLKQGGGDPEVSKTEIEFNGPTGRRPVSPGFRRARLDLTNRLKPLGISFLARFLSRKDVWLLWYYTSKGDKRLRILTKSCQKHTARFA
jgi:hypothetical protein